MTTYNWDLIERLLHEVQNGAGHSFTPRPYAEQHAAAKAAEGEATGNLDELKSTAAAYENCCWTGVSSSRVPRRKAATVRTSG
ncbi:Transcriptional regulator [Pseudomonas chlororaphis subsp. aurantiaca]|nr:Transcriptional regulator [Pseudomonas chlororaphis subsp. aurantiaca]